MIEAWSTEQNPSSAQKGGDNDKGNGETNRDDDGDNGDDIDGGDSDTVDGPTYDMLKMMIVQT